ncbi:MAG: right-handed parallel beta-helix repeat-containing protein [Planctomycetota bacterium]
MTSRSLACALLALLPATLARAEERLARDDATLRAATAGLRPGDVVRVAPGEYRGGLTLEGLAGTPKQPIVIQGQDPKQPPVFVGGGNALHLVRCEHVVLRDLVARGQTGNGVNCDDGGRREAPVAGIKIERLRCERIGPRGNHDGLKLSGLVDFEVRDSTFVGWGGSAIDMVGCHRGTIEGCTFQGAPECSQDSGVQCKGGTSRVRIRGCTFRDAGARALNLGGSTGLPYFRPDDAPHEAKDLTVEGCRFAGSEAPLAFVGVDGAVVRRCTFLRPGRWLARILQESRGERFVPCRNGVFEENVIVLGPDLRRLVNVGDGTEPQTFVFRRNAWFSEANAPDRRAAELPVKEEGGSWGRDPLLDPETLRLKKGSFARGIGADAWTPDEQPAKKRRKGSR